MSKNLVVFCDGTAKEGRVGGTNVVDLFNMIEYLTPRQVAFYDAGLGTGWNGLSRVIGSATGAGITRNVRDCYLFLTQNYLVGDRIYLFGFSRGATTVRTLASFIDRFGMLHRAPEDFLMAWRIYKIRDPEKRQRLTEVFLGRKSTIRVRIHLLGVWDTVAALGLPFRSLDLLIDRLPFWQHSFHDLRLPGCVEYARHAVAVDDERRTFHPQLWEEPGEVESDTPPDGPSQAFKTEDIDDVYLLAEKLKATYHPVSRRLSLGATTRKLLTEFDPGGRRDESPDRVQALTAAAIADFNRQLSDPESLYQPPSADEFGSLNLSSATRELMLRFQAKSREHARRLDRRLIQESYGLRPLERPRVKQVWFAGMHSDVGGGYPEGELAHIPLVWMVREAIHLGLLIYPGHRVDLNPDARGRMHDSRAGLGRLYRRRRRTWDRETHGQRPLVHESVVARSRGLDLIYDPWILKTDYDLEAWPEGEEGSIQFDDHHVWRESFWGWDAAFAVPWEAVERVSCDDQRRAITIHLKGSRDDIVVRGCLPRYLSGLVSWLERRRKRNRLEEEDRKLRARDARQAERLESLLGKVARLEEQIQTDDAKPGKPEEDHASRRRGLQEDLDELKAEITEFSREVEN